MSITVNITVKDKKDGKNIKNASVEIYKEVNGAYIYYTGEYTSSKKPAKFDLLQGKYQIKIKRKGYKEKEDTQEFSDGEYNLVYSLDRNYNLTISFSSSK